MVQVKGKLGYGTRIFNEGQTAADRREFRTIRRRLNRRKWRLRLLQDFFESYILPVDEAFFLRRKESNLVAQDKKINNQDFNLFSDTTDKKFHEDYPTIYHLRHALMTEKRKFDIREIYLAIHHIVKYRGHFLNNALVSSFKSGELNLDEKFRSLNELFLRLYPEGNFQLIDENLDSIACIIERYHQNKN